MAPLLAAFGLGGIEYTHLVLAHQKGERIASAMADLVARNTLPPTEANIRDVFIGIDRIGAPFRVRERGRVIVTGVVGVSVPGVGIRNKVAWQRCDGTVTTAVSTIGPEWTTTNNYADGPDVTLPNNIVLLQNQMAIVAEVTFGYQPIVSQMVMMQGDRTSTIRQKALFVTRGQAFPYLTPSGGVTPARCT
jgi:Flp pilus assembly protein TadG